MTFSSMILAVQNSKCFISNTPSKDSSAVTQQTQIPGLKRTKHQVLNVSAQSDMNYQGS